MKIEKRDQRNKDFSDQGNRWLAKKYFDEISTHFRSVWDIYIKWYTVFITFQIAGLVATVQYIDIKHRKWIIIAFITQNMLSTITAVIISYYSRSCEVRLHDLASLISKQANPSETLHSNLEKMPIPSRLAFWSGWANAISHVTFIVCWISIRNINSIQ